MARPKPPRGPSVLTANALATGEIVFWAGNSWSTEIDRAVRVADEALRADLEATGRAEEAANRVVGAYLVTLDPVTGEPVELRERHRLDGPSILPSPLPSPPQRAA